MLTKSRRKAREGALRALYEIEVGQTKPHEAIEATVMDMGLSHDLAEYAQRVVEGIRSNQKSIDGSISHYLKEYDISRLAAVDRNLLRIGTFELWHVPEMPPAVTINEMIEIAKRYSTAESGRFINGVLGKMLLDSPKAKWDPATAPKEESESVDRTPEEVEVEEIDVSPDDPMFKSASRIGGWKLRAEESSS